MIGPAFQFYAADWMASVSELSLEERGAYITLLAWSWLNGPVPSDTRKLARILSISESKTRRVLSVILDRFLSTPDGYVSERLELVRAEKAAYLQAQSVKGKASAEKRWGNRGYPPVTPPVTTRLQPDGKSSSSSSSSSSEISSDALRPQRSDARAPDAPVSRPAGGWHRGVMGGAHLRCEPSTWDACSRGVCVPAFLSGQWLQQLGQGADAEATVRAFVRDVLASVPDGPVGDDPLKFWRAAWMSRHGTQAPATRSDKGSRAFEAIAEALRPTTPTLKAVDGKVLRRG